MVRKPSTGRMATFPDSVPTRCALRRRSRFEGGDPPSFYGYTATGIGSQGDAFMRSLPRSIKNFSNDDMAVYAAALSY